MSDNNKKGLSIIGLVTCGVFIIGMLNLKMKDAKARMKAMRMALFNTNKEGESEE